MQELCNGEGGMQWVSEGARKKCEQAGPRALNCRGLGMQR